MVSKYTAASEVQLSIADRAFNPGSVFKALKGAVFIAYSMINSMFLWHCSVASAHNMSSTYSKEDAEIYKHAMSSFRTWLKMCGECLNP